MDSEEVDDDDKQLSLYEAVRLGKTKQVKKIVDRNGFESVELGSFLHQAASLGHEDVVRLFVTKYSCPVDYSKDTKKLLHVACGGGHINTVKMLIDEQHANLHVYDKHNVTPLHEAARSGNTELVVYMIDEYKTFDLGLNLRDWEGKTILHYASQAGHYELVERLITHYHLNPESVDHLGNTPLHLAAGSDRKDVVDLLTTTFKCSVTCRNKLKQTPFHCACKTSYVVHLNTIRILLLKYKDEMNSKVDWLTHAKLLIEDINTNSVKAFDDSTILHYACSHGHIEVIDTLLVYYYLDPSVPDSKGNTPIHSAISRYQQAAALLLINKYNCNINAVNSDNETPLRCACERGLVDVVSAILSLKTDSDSFNRSSTPTSCTDDLTATGYDGKSIVHYACEKGDSELVDMLLTHYNLDPQSVDDSGNTPLHYAAYSGKEEIVKLLLTKFACPLNRKNNKNQTPLHRSCDRYFANKDMVGIVEMFLCSNADLDALDENGETALQLATKREQIGVVKLLVDANCDINNKGSDGNTALHYACRGGKIDMIQILLTHSKLDILSVNDSGDTPFHVACTNGRLDTVKLLLTKQSDSVLYLVNKNNKTPLYCALKCGHVDVANALMSNLREYYDAATTVEGRSASTSQCVNVLQSGAITDLTTKQLKDSIILHSTCQKGYVELVDTLVAEYHLDPMSTDGDGNTTLHSAALRGQKEVLKLLITKYDCPVDCKDRRNETPLHKACRNGRLDIVKMLVLDHTADLSITNESNETPLQVAVESRKVDIVKFLANEFECPINNKRIDGKTALHQACNCYAGESELVQALLVNRNLDPTSVDDFGNTPLHLATSNGRTRLVRMLIYKLCFPIGSRNRKNQTPLYCACKNGHLKCRSVTFIQI